MSKKEGNLSISQHEKKMVTRYKFTNSEWLRWRMTGELPLRVRAANKVRFKDQMAGLNGDKQEEDDFARKSPPTSLEKKCPNTEAQFKAWSLSILAEIKATLLAKDVDLTQLRQVLTLIEKLDHVKTDFINLHYGQNEWQDSFIAAVKQISDYFREMVTHNESTQYQFVAFQIYTYLEDWENLTGFNDRQETISLMKEKIQAEEWELIAKVLSSRSNFSYSLPKILLEELESDFDLETGLHNFDLTQIKEVVMPALIRSIAFKIGHNGYEMILTSIECLELFLDSFLCGYQIDENVNLESKFDFFLKAVVKYRDNIRRGIPSHTIVRQILAVIKKFIDLTSSGYNPPEGTEEFLNKLYYERSVRYNDQRLGCNIKRIAAEFNLEIEET